jgi:hypothetical protein
MLVQKNANCPLFNDINCELLFTALSTKQNIEILHYVYYSLENLCSSVNYSCFLRHVAYIYHTHTTYTFIFAASSAREHSAMQ